MVYFENNKKVRYNPYNMKYDKKIGSGLESDCYLINGEVVKLYNDYCQKIRLNKVEIEQMSKINTRRIIMPSVALLDKKKKAKGYKMKYINSLGYDSFYKMPKNKLTEELKILEDDVNLLTDNDVLLDDICITNTIFNNGAYLIDPGSYTINNLICTKEMNRDRINEYLIYLLVEYAVIKYGKESYNILINIRRRLFLKKYYDIMDYLKDNLEFNNLDELVDYEYKKIK